MGILLRNWHLKLGALALATVLYTGLVFSGSFSEDLQRGVVIDSISQPEGWVLMGSGLGTVDVTYRATAQAAELVTSEAFDATVDLSAYDLARPAQPQSVPVSVRPILPGLSIQSWQPREVTVTLDEVRSKEVPVRVDTGTVPDGLELGRPEVSDRQVTARGASSLLALVDHALARVRIDPSGIDAAGPYDLVAVSVDGSIVQPIELTPSTVTIQIDVRAVETNRTVPVRPQIAGTPAAGFALTALSVEPSTVTLRGLPEVLSGIDELLTEPLDIAGASADRTFEVGLTLPEGTQLAGGASGTTITVTATIVPSVSSRTFNSGLICQGAGANACLPGLQQVSITLSGPGDLLSALTADQITVVLDVTGLPPGTHQVDPGISGLPQGIELIAISPASVPVTIQAPATPPPTPTP